MNIPRIIGILTKYRTNVEAAAFILNLLDEEGMGAMHCELYFHRGRDLVCGDTPHSDRKDMDAYDITCEDHSYSYLSKKEAGVVCENILRALIYKTKE